VRYCIEAVPVQIFQWYRSAQDLPAAEMVDVTSVGIGENHDRDEEKIMPITDPVRENDCIWCMAYVTVYPTQAIKVDEGNLDIYNKTAKETTG